MSQQMEDRVRSDPEFNARYTLEAPLGSGAMGTVWRGVQRALGRPVAVKFMSAELAADAAYRDRFNVEARAVAGLIHSHVTAVFDFGVAGGVPYLVTELVSGESLDRVLQQPDTLSAAERMEVVTQILSALEAIHALGILHRDLKPSNVMIATTHPPHAKLMDFGIAKKLDEERGLTRVGMVLGSPPYMSPEQAAGKKLTPASDLYALTIVLYEMILGGPPFVGESPLETIQARLERDAVVPGDLLPSVATLLRRGLARSPSDRLHDIESFRKILAEATRDVAAAGTFYPIARTLVGRFIPSPQPEYAQMTQMGTAQAQLPQAQAPERSPGGQTAPLSDTYPAASRPALAIVMLAGLIGAAFLMRRTHPPVEPPPHATLSPVPASATSIPLRAIQTPPPTPSRAVPIPSPSPPPHSPSSPSPSPPSPPPSPSPTTRAPYPEPPYLAERAYAHEGRIDPVVDEILAMASRVAAGQSVVTGRTPPQSVIDDLLLVLLDAPFQGAAEYRSRDARGNPGTSLAACLMRLRPALVEFHFDEAEQLLWGLGASHWSIKTDSATRLPAANTLAWLYTELALARAKTPRDVTRAVLGLYWALYSHQHDVIGYWSASTVALVMNVAQMPRARKLARSELSRLEDELAKSPAQVWPGVDRVVSQAREVFRRKANTSESAFAPEQLRPALQSMLRSAWPDSQPRRR